MTHDTPRILVVEDDGRILEEVAAALENDGFEPVLARTLGVARECLKEDVALVLLDLGLPDGDGLELCRELSRANPEQPLIVLTARDHWDDRVRGLDAGADDYVVKPCHMPELLARVRCVLRRSGRTHPADVLRAGDLWLDTTALQVGRGEERLDLKPKEFELLRFLMGHPGRAWTREQLLDRVWGIDYDGDPRTVDVHVRRLRTHLEVDPGRPRLLLTEWGVGYRFEEPA